ncbi:molybdate ABC transporter substrate-binding protein [Zafaria cholistanensis]|uniref:Molybdate ABC transporter substrate-binding protein n=1 Tax=Zafaria cholistanensis TaxID=1682741 RepID=A0A5A7NNK0_9MICC|nr:substrate-binding domain-containing protein [Zafaria cholistanensis]GER22523.1 molybdate ABC transporter substrate-binding protein [Zafaria cholistanensis]
MAAVAAALLAALLGGCSGADRPSSPSAAIAVSAPASFADVAPQLVAAYKAAGGAGDPQLNLGSSAQLIQQANAGLVPDLLITADTPALEALGDPGAFERRPDLAANAIVLAVPAGGKVRSLADLAGQTVAVCAPQVPCGRAANAYLKARSVMLEHPTEEDNVRAVLTKVTSGAVAAGFVYATDARAAGDAVRTIALEGAEPNIYPLLVRDGAGAGAVGFADWLAGGTARDILADAGFGTP